MSQSSPELRAIVKKLQEVWTDADAEQGEYLMRELEALIHRYRESQQ